MIAAFSAILGQPAAVRTLSQALRSGRVHHAYRFEGPSGVGKRRTAIAFAQALLCTNDDERGCGQCSACKRAATLNTDAPRVPQHPDFIWVQRGLYTGSLLSAKEATGISVEQIRKVVLTRTGYGPHEDRALVVLVEDADELTVSAANALLKTLEEPVPGVHFILHSSRPHRLLDTLRSRTLAVRFGPLPDEVLTQLAALHGFDPGLVAGAEGSVERALALSNPEQANLRAQWIAALNRAVQAPHMGPALELAAALPKDRHEVLELLHAYAQHLATRARDAATATSRDPSELARLAQHFAHVAFALDALERNASPNLALEALLVELRA